MAVTKLYLLCLNDGRPQYQIAAELGIPAPQLSEYWHGKKDIPVKRIYRFCEVFRCNPDDLLGYASEDEFAL